MRSAGGAREHQEVYQMLDQRYSIRPEFCGYAERRWVVRFCGEWVGQTASRADSVLMAAEHATRRQEGC